MASPCSLGVVIPCHKPYIPLLGQCLDSIEFQTAKPDRVVVVCSSSQPTDIPTSYAGYSFPLTIITREDIRNQSQNRNEGAALVGTDYVSFFDADDVMHPQRVHYLRAYMPQTDLLLHSYTTEQPIFRAIHAPTVYSNELMRGPTGCVVFKPDWSARIHHAHVTVRVALLKTFAFDEEPPVAGFNEDSLFCGDIVASGARTLYVADPLSWYRLRRE